MIDLRNPMPGVCDIGIMAKVVSSIRRGWFCVLALLYIEGLFVLMALANGSLVFPLLGAGLLAAQLPLAFNGARVFLRATLVHRLVVLSLVFVAVSGAVQAVDMAAWIACALFLISLSGLILITLIKAAPVARAFREHDDTKALEYCLFGDRAQRSPVQNLLTPRFRPALPWFTAGTVLVGLGIALSIITDRNFVIFFVIPAVFLFHRGRRHMAPRASEVKQVDDRPPILILRSFEDDRITTERFSMSPRRTFEQVVATALKIEGPAIIIGEPDESLPRLGALREYFANDDWQTAVTKLIDEVALLVFVLGDTENLLWELRQVIDKGRKADVFIIVPPIKRQLLESRWQVFTGEGAAYFWNCVPPELPDDTILGLFFVGNDPVFIVSRKRSVIDFRLGIRLFLRLHRDKITSFGELRDFVQHHLPIVSVQ